jgi:hypothetical protein
MDVIDGIGPSAAREHAVMQSSEATPSERKPFSCAFYDVAVID